MRVFGKVVRFDDMRGYGFIAPDLGGEDVFLHANDLEIDRDLIRPGVRVSFEVEDGPRGQFATGVQRDGDSPGQPEVRASGGSSSSDDYYDYLSGQEFKQTVTEILLEIPSITGEQIRQVRAALEALARKHGWVE